MEENKKIIEFLGKKVIFDDHGQQIYAEHEDGGLQIIADIRGWGAIQNLFKEKDGSINEYLATTFQDGLGRWVAEAINEKLARETLS